MRRLLLVAGIAIAAVSAFAIGKNDDLSASPDLGRTVDSEILLRPAPSGRPASAGYLTPENRA